MPGTGYPGVWPDFRWLKVQNHARNALQGPDVLANGQMSREAGCPLVAPDVRAPNLRMNSRNSILGAEIDDFGGKIAEISWMKVGKIGGKRYPLVTKQIHGSNPTKLHHTNKS